MIRAKTVYFFRMKPHIIGTAGHIDHGKSALVRALTGTDPDRFEEEKRRGMTIDIGFAFLGENIAFIDVPGHEKFIRNMVTGVSTIDVAILVIAADDGIMPQTREHLEILKLLGIANGIIAITKVDLVDQEWLDLVAEDVHDLVKHSFLETAPVFRVSNISGQGLEELKAYLLHLTEIIDRPLLAQPVRMPVDRVFSSRGYGTIVTGSLLSGELRVGDTIAIFPIQKRARIRRLESHNQELESIGAGHRCALNLQGLEKREIERGCFVAAPDSFCVSPILTVRISLSAGEKPLDYNVRVRVHLGTGEMIAKIRFIGRDQLQPGEACIAQLVFDENVSAGFRDRFILRSYSSLRTIGGGLVLDVNPQPLKKKQVSEVAFMETLRDAAVEDWLKIWFERNGNRLFSELELARRFTQTPETIRSYLQKLVNSGLLIAMPDGYILAEGIRNQRNRILDFLSVYHRRNPMRSGIRKTELLQRLAMDENLANRILAQLEAGNTVRILKEKISLYEFEPQYDADQANLLQKIENRLLTGQFTPPGLDEIGAELGIADKLFRELIEVLSDSRKIVVIDKNIVFHGDVLARGEVLIRGYLQERQAARAADLRDLLQTSRKWVIPLLNYYDRIGLTYRHGDERRLQ